MDLITLAAAKKYTNKVAAGITAARVKGSSIILTLTDGTEAVCQLPTPKDGISVIDLSINTDGSLLCHMSDGSTIDAGKVPTIEPDHVQADWNQNDETQPDYIKNRIGGYEAYREIPVFENKTVTLTKKYPDSPDDYRYEYFLTDEELNLYQQYFPEPEMTSKFVYKGKEYVQTTTFDVDTFTCPTICNTDICLVQIPSMGRIDVDFYDAESINTEFTFSLYKMGPSIIPIPEKYIPNTIATKQYVDDALAAITNGDEVSY